MSKFQQNLLIIGFISFGILCLLFLSLYCFQRFIPEVSQEKIEPTPTKEEDLTSEDIHHLANYLKKETNEITESSLNQEEENLLIEQEVVTEKEAEELLTFDKRLTKEETNK